MKPFYLFIAAALCCILASSCARKDSSDIPAPSASGPHKSVKSALGAMARSDDSLNSTVITIDTANKMLTSYLSSIPANESETTLRSFTFNADSLRAYLADPNVKNVKFMIAHTLTYINAGNNGQPAGLKAGAVTLIMAGYDGNGDYRYIRNGVMDHALPCPNICLTSGTASSFTLTQ